MNSTTARRPATRLIRSRWVPLPRVIQWPMARPISTMELVRKRNAEVPANSLHRPAGCTRAAATISYRPCDDDVIVPSTATGIDFEAEIAVVTGDAHGHGWLDALDGIRLVMLANDVSLRNLDSRRTGQGLRLSRASPPRPFSPVAVTLDELGDASEGRPSAFDAAEHLERPQGRHVRCGRGDDLSFGQLRPISVRRANGRAVSIVGSGTVGATRAWSGRGKNKRMEMALAAIAASPKTLHRDHPGRMRAADRVHEVPAHTIRTR